jgi:hypothetical protein
MEQHGTSNPETPQREAEEREPLSPIDQRSVETVQQPDKKALENPDDDDAFEEDDEDDVDEKDDDASEDDTTETE